MKKRTILFAVLLSSLSLLKSYTQDYKVRIGFLGNSITIGSGLSNQKTECYPTQIGELLKTVYGDTCEIGNFAVSGRTLLKNGDFPLWNEQAFDDGWVFAPDICFICLGTNDTKPQNWDSYKDEFLDDYLSMIDSFKVRNPNTQFIVCYPPPAFGIVWGIRDSVVVNGVIPNVDSVLKKRQATLIDFYTPLIDSVYLFPDLIHPNAAGAKVMAKIAFDRIVETDLIHKVSNSLPFVTNLESEKEEIRQGDSVLISWSTTNTDEVFLNDQLVVSSGSMKVLPLETTTYKLVASNSMGKDSLSIVQNVYVPTFTLLSISPYRITIREGEQLNLNLSFIDQKGIEILTPDFDVTWSIPEGTGTITNKTNTSAIFVAEGIGKTKVKAEAQGISFSVNITVEKGSSLRTSDSDCKVVFPNPFNKLLTLQFGLQENETVKLRLIDLNGKVQLSRTCVYSSDEDSGVSINTSSLEPGIYIYQLEYSDKSFTGIITKSKE